MPKRAALATVGCRVNQYETQYLREQLERAGYEIVPFHRCADLYVINTCTVTHRADKKSISLVRKSLSNSQNAQICITGCMAEVDENERGSLWHELLRRYDLCTIARRIRFVPNEEKLTLGGLIGTPLTGISSFSGHDRAFVKVEDGCNQYCSYCRIPYVRGERIRSKRPDDVIAEVQQLVDFGYAEVVLSGVNLALYGTDLSERIQLTDLLDRLEASLQGTGFRVRLGSLEPHLLPHHLVQQIAASPLVCPHLHLSFQHGSDRILEAMRRPYAAELVSSLVDRFRRTLPLAGITGDVIIGFPGETDADFEQTLTLVRSIGLHRLHVFRFSARAGTPAVSMPAQVPEPVKYERARQMRLCAGETSKTALRRLVGTELPVLVEQNTDADTGWPVGYADNYARVLVWPGTRTELSAGCIYPVRILREEEGKLVGVPV